jgi:hypothetical protein
MGCSEGVTRVSDGYPERVLQAYQGEVYGEALFGALAERARDPDARHKWRTLERLERETKLRLAPLVVRLCGRADEDDAQRERGRKDADALGAVAWSELMQLFAREFPKFIDEFESLERAAPARDAGVMALLSAHEKALAAFARAEAEGDAAHSLEPVLALLAEPPSRE